MKCKATMENAPEELAADAAPERVVLFLDQPPNLLWKDDHKHKDGDVVLETDTTLKESERENAMKQQKSTNSRTTSRPENLGFTNTVEKALYPEATQTSKKRGWKPSFLNKPDEGYDDAWISGERRSKAHILSKGCGTDAKKRSSSSSKRAISNGESGAEERDKRWRSSVGESGAEALGSVSNTKEINFPKACKKQRKQRKRKNWSSQEKDSAD
ncbi:hypothetical protein AABB24_027037 [Solanum stoloniferum]